MSSSGETARVHLGLIVYLLENHSSDCIDGGILRLCRVFRLVWKNVRKVLEGPGTSRVSCKEELGSSIVLLAPKKEAFSN